MDFKQQATFLKGRLLLAGVREVRVGIGPKGPWVETDDLSDENVALMRKVLAETPEIGGADLRDDLR